MSGKTLTATPHIEFMSLHIMLSILLLSFYFKIFILQIRKSVETVAHWKRMTENAVPLILTVNGAASKRQCNVLHLEILHILHFKAITPTPTHFIPKVIQNTLYYRGFEHELHACLTDQVHKTYFFFKDANM